MLARRLFPLRRDYDVVVAIPRGGVVVGSEISKFLNLPLVPLVIKKVSTFAEPELAAGAVGPEGFFVGKKSREAEKIVLERIKKYGGLIDFSRKRIILVDDGVATGTTIETAISYLRKKDVGRVLVAVPVVAKSEFERLKQIADKAVALEIPVEFMAIGEFYRDFTQVTDEEVIQLLQ